MKYILKKDTPYHKKGEMFIKDGNNLIPEENRGIRIFLWTDYFIDNMSDWFDEYQEPKWTDQDMKKFATWTLSQAGIGLDDDGAMLLEKFLTKIPT